MSDIHDNPIDDADGARRDALIGSARSLLPDIRQKEGTLCPMTI